MIVVLLVLLVVSVLVLAAYRAFRAWYDEQGELERLARPVDPNAGITPQATNLAVLTYVYGIPRQDVPGDHRVAVGTRFGGSAAALQWSVDRLLELAAGLRDEAADAGGDPGEAVVRELRERYPDMSADAAHALSAWASTHRPDPGRPSSGWTPL